VGDQQRHLRSVGDLEAAVETTIASLTAVHVDEDAGAIALARKYAHTIDEAKDERARASAMRWIAPQLLDVLESLGATPVARARMKGGKVADVGPSVLDELRAKGARRSA
jgi:hypothetical protein